MKLLITESQFKVFSKKIISDLNNKFADTYEICKFEYPHTEEIEDYPIISLKIDAKWVKTVMGPAGFGGKEQLNDIIKLAKEFVLEKFGIYVDIRPYAGKC
jgi:hypothetical protein